MKRTPLRRKAPLKSKGFVKSRQRKRTSKSNRNVNYTKELRESIFVRDGGQCVICGRPGEQIHHVIPRGRFYSQWYHLESVHDPRNLCLVCSRCHRNIHDIPGMLDEVISMQEKRFGRLRKEATS